MNDPNAVPLDRIPVSTPSIPRFGGLPELPELPGEFAPLPPYRTPTSVTTVPFPSSPPKVVVEPPKAPPKVTVELPKPIMKPSPSDTASPAPQPRWVREAIQDLLTPNRKKGLALTVAAGLVIGAIALNAGFSGIGSPTRSSNSLVAATTPEKPASPKAEEPTPDQIMNKQYPRDDVWGHIFWDGMKWKGSVQLEMPYIPDSGGMSGQYVVAQPIINLATYTEPPVPLPVVIPMPPTVGASPSPPVIPDLNKAQPVTIPPSPVLPPTPIMPVVSVPVGLPDIKSLTTPVIQGPSAPVTPEPVKIADVAPPAVPKPTPVVTTPVVSAPAALLTPNGMPSPFTEEPPLTVAPSLPVPQPPAQSLTGLTFPVPAPQAPALQPIPQPAIRPVTNSEVRTAIDVDLHEPKRGDTYASISKMHYGDDRYAAAIQAFNKGRNLGDGAAIELPLTQYLRQNYRQYIGGTPPVSNDPARTPDWAPSAGRAVPTPRTFTVNREGMTMWDVAEDVYGDRQKWRLIQAANPQLDANEGYRIGERFRLPLDAPQTVKRVP